MKGIGGVRAEIEPGLNVCFHRLRPLRLAALGELQQVRRLVLGLHGGGRLGEILHRIGRAVPDQHAQTMRLGGSGNTQAQVFAIGQIPKARIAEYGGSNHIFIGLGACDLHDVAAAIEWLGIGALRYLHYDLAGARRDVQVPDKHIFAVERWHLKHAARANRVAQHHLVAMHIQALVMRPRTRQWSVGFLVQAAHTHGVIPLALRTAPAGVHRIGKGLRAADGGMRIVPAVKGDAAPIDGAAGPTGRAIEQVRVVQHERLPLGKAALTPIGDIQPDGDALVDNPRSRHFQRVRKVRAVVHLIPFAGKQRRGHENGKEERNAFHK